MLYKKKPLNIINIILITILIILFTLGIFLFKNRIFGYNSLTDFIKIEKSINFYYPVELTLMDISEGIKSHEVKIILDDGFTNIEAYNNNVNFVSGKANLLIEINPSLINIDKNVKIKTFIDGVDVGHIREHLVSIYSDYSTDSDFLINEDGRTYRLEDLVTINNFDQTINTLITDIEKQKSTLMKKDDLEKYVILKNGKINVDLLPFSMNNLTCNIKMSDLDYLQSRGMIQASDRPDITLNKECRDGMTDIHQLVQIAKSLNKEDEFLGGSGTYKY